VYIDWETSWAITADYNGISTSVAADWDFTNNAPHKWGDGTEVLAEDLDGDTYNDYSMGSFAWVYDIFNLLTGDIFGGIDAQGRGFSYMFDEGGHGTSVAGSAAGRGIQMMDLYGNGTLYNTPGVAPGAEIMALKIFTFGDYITSWFWGAGYHPSVYPYGTWFDWAYTGAHQCEILSNSWGYTNQLFTAPYNFIWGCDWASYTVDFLSTGALEDYNDYAGPPHYAPTFVISSGNAGPGYGTSGSPAGGTAVMVGASTTTHYVQPTYNNDSSLGPQPYDQIADFSSCGPKPQGAPLPDLVAPGAWSFDIAPLHNSLGNGSEAWTTFGGTSQSAPMTSGVLALMYQVTGMPGEAGPGRSGGFYKSLLKASADNINQPALRQGAGRLNAYKAVTMTIGFPFDAFGNPMNYMFSDYTFENWAIPHDPATWSRSWYMNMYFGGLIGVPYYLYDSYYHPGVSGFSGAPNVTWNDGGFTTHSMKPGDTKNIQVQAGLAGGIGEIGAMDAESYTLLNESSQTFTSTSVLTTYPLFATGHFDQAFQAQFMSADYAVIHLAYDPAQFEAIYALAGQANYVFLHDWNDTNANGIIDLQSATSVGEVRRVMFDYSATPVHQIHVGSPGAQWNGNRNATIYYHDVGNELFLWRTLDVTVTIRLYNRVDWNWFSFTWLGPQNWDIQVDVPVSATPGFYSGFVTETTAGYTEYFPVIVKVDGEVAPGESLTWGGTDGHPYDNGAITGGLDWDGRTPSGEWRYYWIDVADINVGNNFTTWIMTNVTWSDPNTVIDVYVSMGGYGCDGYLGGNVQSVTEYVGGGRWDGEPSWPMQNVLFTDFTWDPGSCSDRGYFGIGLHVSRYGGMYVPENFTITVTPVNNETLLGFHSIPGSTAMLNASSHGDAAIIENSTWTGPNVMFEATWSPLSVAGFPNLEIRQTRIELVSGVEQENYGTIIEGFIGGWHPDLNPREDYDYVELLAGQEVYIEVEFGTWTAGEGSPLTHTGSDDIDVFVWAPDVPHTYANSLTGSTTATGNNPEIGRFIAPVSGEYTIGMDWYSGAQPMGWRSYVLASQATGLTEDGLSAEIDTSVTDTNAAYTIRAVLITGTLLDADADFARYEVRNVTVTNFFMPTVQVTYPNGGEVVGPGPVNITWTASDQNTDETLGFSVEVSNDTGTTWKVVVYGTTLQQATWDPQSPFYGLPAGDQFLVRINCTDGRYVVFDESDAVFTLQTPVAPVYLPLELITVVAVAVIVIVILVITCILKRRQSAAK
jgi:hypothetical protein